MKKLLFLALMFAGMACSKEETTESTPNEEKTTYEFTRNGESSVSYSGQIERIEMLTEMGDYMAKVNQFGSSVSGDTLVMMFKNEGGFSKSYAKQLFNKCYAADQAYYQSVMEEMAQTSRNNTEASPGVAGFLNEEYPLSATASSAGYLVDANGLEYRQVILKGLMGAVFFYQAVENYFGVDDMNMDGADNLSVVDGKNYTSMEHHYDEAFGYFGVATDFSDQDVVKDGVRAQFWGHYTIDRHIDGDDYGMNGINSEIMSHFIKGREYVVAKDYAKRNQEIQEVVNNWELVIANTAANYFERCLSKHQPEVYKKHHYLSEGIAFLVALQYHFENGNSVAERFVDYAGIESALNTIGLETNLYAVTDVEITQVLNAIENAIPSNEFE